MSLKERLDEELKDVAFSQEQQEQLKARLMLLFPDEQDSKGLMARLKRFWHGSTEIPLPVAAAAVLVLGIGLWSSCYTAFAVDQSQAALLLQAVSLSLQVISQGVSVL